MSVMNLKPDPKFWAKWGTGLFILLLVTPPYTEWGIYEMAELWVGSILFVVVIQILYPVY